MKTHTLNPLCLNPDTPDFRIGRICRYIRNRVNPLILTIGVLTILTACDDKATQEAEAAKAAAETAIAAAKAKEAAAKEAIAKLKAAASPAVAVSGNTFTDARDKKTYKMVTIGKQTWMAENLNYAAEGSKCYNLSEYNCQKYGRLYEWETAKKACPSGWHLPSKQEWDNLLATAGGDVANKKLKAKRGWENDNGTDEFGFSALPSGVGNSGDNFSNVGICGGWWTATEYEYGSGAYYRAMCHSNDDVNGDNSKDTLHGVRCVKD